MELNKPADPPDGGAGPGDRKNVPARRSTVRTALRCAATLLLPGDLRREVHTCDVSRDGLSLLTARPVAPGTRCQVQFELPLADRTPLLALAAKAVYSSYTGPEGFRVGLLFAGVDADAERAIDEFIRLEKP